MRIGVNCTGGPIGRTPNRYRLGQHTRCVRATPLPLSSDGPTTMHPILPPLLRIAAIVAAICLVAAFLIWHNQERFVFQPSGPPYPDARGARRIDFRAGDGQPLFAYLVGEVSERGL